MRSIRNFILTILLITPFLADKSHTKELVIVTDILPIQTIVQGVVGDLQTSVALIPANVSSHDFALKPSQIRALQHADLIVWLGDIATPGLAKLLSQPEFASKSLALNELPETLLLAVRSPGVFDHTQPATSATHDPHTWLDPENAIAWSAAIANRLTLLDPENERLYESQRFTAETQIAAAQIESAVILARRPILPFAQYHDAFQYFERHFKQRSIGALTVEDEASSSLGTTSTLRSAVQMESQTCIFVQNAEQEDRAQPLLEIPGTKAGYLDAIGAGLPEDQRSYPALLLDLANGFSACETPQN